MRIWSTRNSHTLLVKMQNGTATWKKVFKFFIKLNVCLLHDPGIYLWSLYNNKNLHSYKNLYVNIYSSSIHNWQKTGNNSNVLQQVNGREKIKKKKKKHYSLSSEVGRHMVYGLLLRISLIWSLRHLEPISSVFCAVPNISSSSDIQILWKLSSVPEKQTLQYFC